MQEQTIGGWLSRFGAPHPMFPALTALPVLCLLPFAAAHANEPAHPTTSHHPLSRHAPEKHVAERRAPDHHVIEHHTVEHRVAERRTPEHHVIEHHAAEHRVVDRRVAERAVDRRVAERGPVHHVETRHPEIRRVVYAENRHVVTRHPTWHGRPIVAHAFYRGMSCVPFARVDSGIDLAGNAWQWWGHAAGVYARGQEPERGAVLNFRANGRMRLGHVAVVDRVVNAREITVDQANWPGPGNWGNISRDVPVVDVSPNNDWTAVRVGLGRSGQFGSVYPTYGFIYNTPDHGGPLVASVARPAPTPILNPPPRDLRSPAERRAASRASFNEVAEAPAIAAPDDGHDLAVGSSLRLDAPDRSLR